MNRRETKGRNGNTRRKRRRDIHSESRGEIPPIPRMTTGSFREYSQLYQFGSAATVTISGKALLNWIMVAATATTSYRPFAAYRLRRIQVWSPLVVGATSNTGTLLPQIGLEFYGPTKGWLDSKKFIAMQDGEKPAYLDVRPTDKSTLSDWMQSGSVDADTTDTILVIAGLLGTVVRVSFAAKLVDDETPYGAEAPVGATVGKTYYNYLDGRASGVIAPVGVNIVP